MTRDRYRAGGIRVTVGKSSVVELPPLIWRARITGLLFETDKSFLLPVRRSAIRGLREVCDQHPIGEALVVGHTDRAGPTSYNVDLSVERAEAIAAFLRKQAGVWLAWYGSDKPAQKRWSFREDQHMLSALSDGEAAFYAGPINGRNDAATQAAARRFQEWSNAKRGTALSVDGFDGPETRRAMIEAYMDFEGTTLPPTIALKTHGCGPFHNEVSTAEGVAEPRNRRVEVFFFDGPVTPPARQPCPSPGCTEYPQWLANTLETVDLDGGQLTVIVTDHDQQPLRDATVRLSGPSSESQSTGTDGRAQFAGLSDGEYTVTVTHDGYSAASAQAKIGDQSTAALDGNGSGPDDVLPVQLTPLATAITSVTLKAVSFTSSHGMLRDNQKDYELSGPRYHDTDPNEWTPSHAFPCSQTRGTTVEISVTLEVAPANATTASGHIVGSGAEWYHPMGTQSLYFYKDVSFKAGDNVFALKANQPLPDEVDWLAQLGITFTGEAGGKSFTAGIAKDLEMFVTYAKPDEGNLKVTENGVTYKRMKAAVQLFRSVAGSPPYDPHAVVETLMKKFSRYAPTPDPAVPGAYDHPGYNPPPGGTKIYGGAWPMADYLSSSGECQAIVRFVRGVLHQLGVPGDADGIVVFADPLDSTKGKTAIEKPIPNAGLARTLPHPTKPQTMAAALIGFSVTPSDVNKTVYPYDDAHVLNYFEACLKFTYGGTTKYHAAGVSKSPFTSAQKVLSGTFNHLIWYYSVDPADPSKGFLIQEITQSY